ncbi:MAG: NRDE family protein [Pyrinomonadaceae bacterium]|nr:NRDE family protein [Pyrinomonadaceae bacterium]
MCIILLAHEAHPEYTLVLAANRDEFYGRPTREAHFWKDAPDTLAGRDLERGGTWLGVTRTGRIAAVTNYREPGARIENAPSRGLLVSDFLAADEGAYEYLARLQPRASLYNGFNLIVGDGCELCYFSNRGGEPQTIRSGVHGLSNHLLDTPWPKVERGREALEKVLESDALSIEAIFKVLADDARAQDEALPETGVGLELERMLSPLFIESQVYGTRSSTVILFNRQGEVIFIERTFNRSSGGREDVRYEFKIRS